MLDKSRQRENKALNEWANENDITLYSDQGAGLCSVLAANKPSSVAMVFGARAALWVNHIMQGSDINSRVVFNVNDSTLLVGLNEILCGDLRYTVHSQDYMTFIDDIRRYKMALFVIDIDLGEALFHQAMSLLDNEGFVILLGAQRPNWEFSGLEIASWRLDNCEVTILTRQPALAMPRDRKGGRSGRRIRS